MHYERYDLRVKAYELKDGIKMPNMGLGLYRLHNYNILYKTLDFSMNEEGRVIADSGPIYFDREHMERFIRGQIPIPLMGLRTMEQLLSENTIAVNWRCVTRFFKIACHSNPGTVHIDIYLVHFKDYIVKRQYDRPVLKNFLAIAKIRDVSKLVGISHFTMKHLRELTEVMAFGLMIEQNDQFEYHPHHVDVAFIRFCIYNNLVYHTAQFFRGMSFKNRELLLDPVAKKIANKHGSSPAEVLLAWALQHGIAAIAKNDRITRMRDNIPLNLKLSAKDIKALNTLGVYNKNNCWDPSNVA